MGDDEQDDYVFGAVTSALAFRSSFGDSHATMAVSSVEATTPLRRAR